ncbi:hypothetical protein D7X48_18250 [bacterium D16-50]|nr:hypothetical protein D7X48_18250 [bacterium D16-50]
MGFREQLSEDMAVFFNPEEFAEKHTINGVGVTPIIDNDTLAELYIQKDTETESLFTDSVLMYVQQSELDFEPVPDQYLDFDGRTYIVTDVKLAGGVYAFVLGVKGH